MLKATDLLIAPPSLPDSRFRDSVMMLTHHDNSGAHALVLNRSLNHTLDQVLEDSNCDLVQIPPLPVYWGGPINLNSIWMLHSTDWHCGNTVIIDNNWAMTSSHEMFHCLADHDCPSQFRLFVGYAGWAAGQLDRELAGQAPWSRVNAWLIADNIGPEWLFEQPVSDLWQNAVTLSSQQAVDSWL